MLSHKELNEMLARVAVWKNEGDSFYAFARAVWMAGLVLANGIEQHSFAPVRRSDVVHHLNSTLQGKATSCRGVITFGAGDALLATPAAVSDAVREWLERTARRADVTQEETFDAELVTLRIGDDELPSAFYERWETLRACCGQPTDVLLQADVRKLRVGLALHKEAARKLELVQVMGQADGEQVRQLLLSSNATVRQARAPASTPSAASAMSKHVVALAAAQAMLGGAHDATCDDVASDEAEAGDADHASVVLAALGYQRSTRKSVCLRCGAAVTTRSHFAECAEPCLGCGQRGAKHSLFFCPRVLDGTFFSSAQFNTFKNAQVQAARARNGDGDAK